MKTWCAWRAKLPKYGSQGGAKTRIAEGRAHLEQMLARGERIYGVNTGVGGNIGISLAPEQMDTLQHNLMRHLACGTGQALPHDVVRAATLLRIVTFATGRFGRAQRS